MRKKADGPKFEDPHPLQLYQMTEYNFQLRQFLVRIPAQQCRLELKRRTSLEGDRGRRSRISHVLSQTLIDEHDDQGPRKAFRDKYSCKPTRPVIGDASVSGIAASCLRLVAQSFRHHCDVCDME